MPKTKISLKSFIEKISQDIDEDNFNSCLLVMKFLQEKEMTKKERKIFSTYVDYVYYAAQAHIQRLRLMEQTGKDPKELKESILEIKRIHKEIETISASLKDQPIEDITLGEITLSADIFIKHTLFLIKEDRLNEAGQFLASMSDHSFIENRDVPLVFKIDWS